MIKIYRGTSTLGVALFHLDTGKFLYAELCERDRLVNFVNSFPEHPVEILIDADWKDEVQELFFLIPHIQEIAKVTPVKKLNVEYMLAEHLKEKKVRKKFPLLLALGITLGSLLLIPTSIEYKNSVLIQAQSNQEFAENFINNQPNPESLQQLYISLDNLYSKVRVEGVTYTDGTFKVVFSSTNENLKPADFEGFEQASLKVVSSLQEDKDSSPIHIYELEGQL